MESVPSPCPRGGKGITQKFFRKTQKEIYHSGSLPLLAHPELRHGQPPKPSLDFRLSPLGLPCINNHLIKFMIGIVMAGGQSSRLGQDKSRLSLYGSGSATLLERTVALLQTCTDAVFISCRASQNVFPFSAIHDSLEGTGPAGGILSALRAVNEAILVLPCDLPFMHAALLQRLVNARAQRTSQSVMTAFGLEGQHHIEPLVAIYEQGARMWFEKAAATGQRKLQHIVPEEHRTLVPYSPEEAYAFLNINTPEDLRRALRRANSPCTQHLTSEGIDGSLHAPS